MKQVNKDNLLFTSFPSTSSSLSTLLCWCSPIFICRHLNWHQAFVDYTLSWYHYWCSKCHAQLWRDTRYLGQFFIADGESWSSIVIFGRSSTSIYWNQTKRMDGVYLSVLHRWYLNAWSHLQSSTLRQSSVYCLFKRDSHDSRSYRPGVFILSFIYSSILSTIISSNPPSFTNHIVVSVSWSHGMFCKPPESKTMYLRQSIEGSVILQNWIHKWNKISRDIIYGHRYHHSQVSK